MGVETMLANRVEMGTSIQPPRFRWVPYADALIFPLDNAATGGAELRIAKPSSRSKISCGRATWREAGLEKPPATLAEYLTHVVTPTLERQKQGGAVAEKFEAAYLRSLAFDRVDRAVAGPHLPAVRRQGRGCRGGVQTAAGLPLPLHRRRVRPAGYGGPPPHHGRSGRILRCRGRESAAARIVYSNDPELRKTRFVMLHGGWPFIRRDYRATDQAQRLSGFLAADRWTCRPPHWPRPCASGWSMCPEKVMFGTDAYPYMPEMGWEESGWIATRDTAGRRLAIALTGMLRDGEITRARASELARMVLRENAKTLYGL